MLTGRRRRAENLGEHFHLGDSAPIIGGTQSSQCRASWSMTARESSVWIWGG